MLKGFHATKRDQEALELIRLRLGERLERSVTASLALRYAVHLAAATKNRKIDEAALNAALKTGRTK